MASVRSTIELLITGSTRGLGAAAAEARAMAERIAAAEDRVSDARRRSAEAESRVADVEARLAGARAQHTAALSQIGVAETNLARARENSQGSTTRLSQAEDRLEALRRGGASAETIARAEADIARVRTEADTAAQNLQRAEAQLERARANASRRAGDIAALEERLAQARGNAFRRSEDLARAENDLNAVRRRGTDDMNRQRDGILGVFDALGRLADAFTGADGASTSLLSKLAALNSVFSTIGGPIVQAVVGLLELVAVLGALGEIVGVVGGLIGQAFAGVPALLLAVAAAGGTVALGLDGIKKAAEVLKPAFDQLKRDVSEVFVRQLTPAFRDLAAAIPKLTDGFRFIAVALSGIAQQMIGFVTSARGIEVINGILRGTATLFSSMSPGITAFVQGLLEAANVGKTAFAALGEALGSILGRIGEVFTRLAGDGTIARAVQGLASTLTGLGAVIAPLIELFIRMGAALGDSLGVALQGIGSGIQQVIPFFEKLAQVAGTILVDAFNQLGPPLRELVNSILPGAGQGMDGFARLMHDVVLPAIAGFINFLRTDGIPGFIAFFQGLVFQASSFAASFLRSFDVVLAALSGFFKTLAVMTAATPLGKMFLDAAAATEGFRTKVQGLATTMETVRDKKVALAVDTPGAEKVQPLVDRMAEVEDKKVALAVDTPGAEKLPPLVDRMAEVKGKTVDVTANVPSGPTTGTLGNQVLEGAIGAVISKTVTTTSQVPGTPVVGTQGNQALKSAIDAVDNKTTTTTGNVPGSPTQGTQGNQALTGAIDQVRDKTTTTRTNVFGTNDVTALWRAIDSLHDKTVSVNVITRGFGDVALNAAAHGRASGGPVQPGKTFLVGEQGPELLSLNGQGGFVTTASRTRQILSGGDGSGSTVSAVPGGDAPITVNVLLSQEQIAGIAQVEIARRDRATKRTVLAGAGVTY